MLSTTHSIQLARKALLDFAQLINHVKQIQTLLVNNPVLRENLHEIEELDAEKVVQERIAFAKTILQQNDDFLQRNGMSKNDLAKAIAHLETTHRELSTLLDTLQAHVNETESTEPHSWLSPTGFVKNLKIRFGSDDLLAAYKIIQSIKDTFAPWIEALGEIDRKVSEVNLMREFEAKNVTFCFAEYEPQGTPHLAATGLWLPHLLSKMPPEKIVTNDLEMGQDGLASTIIVSGPTEGGKSTILRTAACAALMAQTVGFVPATRWIATPLDRVLLSFNAADNLGKTVTKTAAADTQTGTSGFRDEVESIKHIVQEMSKLTPGQHALIIIDELFQKVQRSGEYFSEQVIRQNFIAANNTLSVIVSHREQPKYLERETAGRCKNYHFVLRQDGDKLVNTYRIEPGALFRPEHKVVTLQEIMRNQEDAYNLQMTQEAGILMGPLTQPSIRMRTGHSPSTPREALETSPLTAPV
jgi:DNA mismatch repair ATPase MutS